MGAASSTSMMAKNSMAASLTSTSFLVLLLSSHVSSNPLPSNIFFPDTVVCLTTTATPQDFNLADPNNCRIFWQCRKNCCGTGGRVDGWTGGDIEGSTRDGTEVQ